MTPGSRALPALLLSVLTALAACGGPARLEGGRWRAWLDSPGGDLPFALELELEGRQVRAAILNGPERIEIPDVSFDNGDFVLDMPQYDSRVTARLTRSGRLDGTWRRRSGPESWTEMAFHADRGNAPRFPAVEAAGSAHVTGAIDGRWAMDFGGDDDPSVGIFATEPDGSVTGTILNTTGDYRYLAGSFDAGRLRLSCFDGGHAFLFDARMKPDGTLEGDFWSREVWHDTWTASRDPEAALPNAFGLTKASGTVELSDLSYPDLEGNVRSLGDPGFAGKVRLIELFGSWCPNCGDAAPFMVELDRRYRERGLSVIGLAFEMSGDLDRDTNQVRLYAVRHDARYPILVAGLSDKGAASKTFPLLESIHAWPTFVFTNEAGEVKAIYQGFSGPATGEAYDTLRRDFAETIEKLLGEAAAGVLRGSASRAG